MLLLLLSERETEKWVSASLKIHGSLHQGPCTTTCTGNAIQMYVYNLVFYLIKSKSKASLIAWNLCFQMEFAVFIMSFPISLKCLWFYLSPSVSTPKLLSDTLTWSKVDCRWTCGISLIQSLMFMQRAVKSLLRSTWMVSLFYCFC